LIAGFIALMFDFQTQIMFPTHAVAPPGPLPPGSERHEIEISDGDVLHGVHIPASSGRHHTLILGFAGNAWNSEDAAAYLHKLYPDADVVTFHYRGYRPSTGSPSAKALLRDAPLVYDHATKLLAPQRTIAVGFSIGSGVAAALAQKRPLDGLILVTPFDSLKAVASGHYPFLPVGTLFRHDMDAAKALERSNVSTAIVAAGDDTLITPRRTDALRVSVGNLRYDQTIDGAGHNDVYYNEQFHRAMHEALHALTGVDGQDGTPP
jgi:pimeloyl-ACP methyl ester carboxylesterase